MITATSLAANPSPIPTTAAIAIETRRADEIFSTPFPLCSHDRASHKIGNPQRKSATHAGQRDRRQLPFSLYAGAFLQDPQCGGRDSRFPQPHIMPPFLVRRPICPAKKDPYEVLFFCAMPIWKRHQPIVTTGNHHRSRNRVWDDTESSVWRWV